MIDMRTAIIKIDSLGYKIDRIAEGQSKSNLKLSDLSGTVGIVKDQLGNHIIRTTNDKQDIINFLNAFEKKNMTSYTDTIPSSLKLYTKR
jgi:hypothetical protein